jgi:hypothetical protein
MNGRRFRFLMPLHLFIGVLEKGYPAEEKTQDISSFRSQLFWLGIPERNDGRNHGSR